MKIGRYYIEDYTFSVVDDVGKYVVRFKSIPGFPQEPVERINSFTNKQDAENELERLKSLYEEELDAIRDGIWVVQNRFPFSSSKYTIRFDVSFNKIMDDEFRNYTLISKHSTARLAVKELKRLETLEKLEL